MAMTKNLEELFLSLRNKLPYSLSFISFNDNYYLLKDNTNRIYKLIPLDMNDYKIYYSLYKSKFIASPIYEFKYQNSYYLLYYQNINNDEYIPQINKLINLSINLFNEFKYSLELKKSHLSSLVNLYKLLDNKFTYLEIRIREIELKPKKQDPDWIILSNYHIILDAKLYLYDLQDDLFKLIDKKEEIEYGLIYKDIYNDYIYDNKLYPSKNIYYGPLGMLYTRLYLEYGNIVDLKPKIDKLSSFNKKYFLFMTLYICILNLNLDIIITNKTVTNYILVTKLVSNTISYFKDYVK